MRQTEKEASVHVAECFIAEGTLRDTDAFVMVVKIQFSPLSFVQGSFAQGLRHHCMLTQWAVSKVQRCVYSASV